MGTGFRQTRLDRINGISRLDLWSSRHQEFPS